MSSHPGPYESTLPQVLAALDLAPAAAGGADAEFVGVQFDAPFYAAAAPGRTIGVR